MVVYPNEYSLYSNLNANKFIASCTQQFANEVEYKKATTYDFGFNCPKLSNLDSSLSEQ